MCEMVKSVASTDWMLLHLHACVSEWLEWILDRICLCTSIAALQIDGLSDRNDILTMYHYYVIKWVSPAPGFGMFCIGSARRWTHHLCSNDFSHLIIAIDKFE